MDLLVEIENTGYQKDIFNHEKLKKLFDIIKFKLIISHVMIDATDNYEELSRAEMLDKNSKKTKRPPLQKNTIYCYCKLKKFNETCNIVQSLIKQTQTEQSQQVRLPPLNYDEHNYNPIEFPMPIQKDLIFLDTESEIGWYNQDNNILWISDIGFFKEKVIINFETILKNIIEFLRCGHISILPNLTIGCDIEFELFDGNNRFVSAAQYLQDLPNRDTQQGNEIGIDGNGITGEIRPAPANNPLRMARHIKWTVKKLVNKLLTSNPELKIYCGGGLSTHLGGHIHFNISNFNKGDQKLKHILFDLIEVHIKRGMNQNSVRLIKGELMYRDAYDGFRLASSHVGMEWRCPPSFILNNTICKAVLCTTWCVIKEYYRGGFTKDTFDYTEAPTILTSLYLYKYYKTWIDKFIELFINSTTEMEGKDLRKEWGLKLNVCNLTVISKIDWISKFFRSLRINNERIITINIDCSDSNDVYSHTNWLIYTRYPLSNDLQNYINNFAETHFVSVHTICKELGYDLKMMIPWNDPPNTKLAYEQLKIILKKIIIEIAHNKDCLL